MAVYTFGVIISMILGYLYTKYKRLHNKTVAIKVMGNAKYRFRIDMLQFFPMIPLAVIAGIRYNVGKDYMYTYVPVFKQVLAGNSDEAWGDWGYIFLNKIVTCFTDDYAGIFILTSCMFILFTFKAIYEESDNVALSIMLLVFMGYYFCFMNGVRQMLATSILLYSIKYIRKRDLIKFVLCIIGGSLIHLSAILFIPVFFLYNKKWDNKKMLLSATGAFLMASVLSKIATNIIAYTKYSWYLDSAYRAERSGVIMIIINIVILIFAMLFNSEEKNEIYIKLQCLSVISTAFIGKIPVANRIQWIFGFSGIILVPNIINCQKDKKMKFVMKIVIILLYASYFTYTIGVKNSNSVLPYQTIYSR